MNINDLNNLSLEEKKDLFKKKSPEDILLQHVKTLGLDLPVSETRLKSFDAYWEAAKKREVRYKELEKNFGTFNPEVHVVVTKDVLSITKQLQEISAINEKLNALEDIKNKVDLMGSDVQYVKSRYTLKAPNTPKPTSKEGRKEDLRTLWTTPKK